MTKLAVVAVLAPLLAAALSPGRAASKADDRWVGTWATSQQLTEPNNLPPAPGLTDTTLRQIVHVSIGGSRLRLRLSNAFGTRPLTILSAHIATGAGGSAVAPETDTPLAFSGQASVTIPPGESAVSDAVDFALQPLSNVAVTIHVADPSAEVTGHPGSRTTSYLQAGDTVSAPSMPSAATTEHWYYIAGIDVVAQGEPAAVAIVGNSLTDGRGSTTDRNNRWPDQLAIRLQANPATKNIGVLNAGIGGNRVRHDGLGPSALARLDRDVLAPPGVRWAVVFEGINDLGTRSGTADDLIAAYREIVERCHAAGIRVYGATITPCGESNYASPALEAERLKVNEWIRAAGNFDAVIDFDAAVRDPDHSSRLLPTADVGDHLHLTPEGYRMLAGAVNLGLFGSRQAP